MPKYYMALPGGDNFANVPGSATAVVGDTFTGQRLLTVRAPGKDKFVTVSAAADDRPFVLGAEPNPEPPAIPMATDWYLVHVTPGARFRATADNPVEAIDPVTSMLMGAIEVSARLDWLIRGLVAGEISAENEAPAAAKPWLDDLLSKTDTYRDAALIVLAFAVDSGSAADIARPPDGRRGVSQRLAGLFDTLNIRARRDAFQTLAKGTDSLLGRNRESWNCLLDWAQGQDSIEPVDQAMRYMATRIAATARDLPPMPRLDVSRLSFRRVVRVTDGLLSQPSGGAHEQFVLAALLHAQAEEYGNRRVETKTLNASDASAGTAADVQVLEGGRLAEAYEVTANRWESKIAQALAVLMDYDLPRVHIVAPGAMPAADEIRDAIEATSLPSGLMAANVDLSVLDVRHECRSIVHRLTRPGRRSALNRLREHLAMRQPNDALVGAYVSRLAEAGVTVIE